MAFFKSVFQYTQVDHGFSELYYREASSLADAATFTTNFITRAVGFRHGLTVLRKVRVSDVANNRSSVVVNVNRGSGSFTATPDQPFTSAMWTLVSTAPPSKRQVWFRGLFDDAVLRLSDTGADNPSPSLLSNVQLFVNNLANFGYSIRSLARLTVPPLIYSPISAITVAAGGAVTLSVPGTFSLTTSGRVIISQVNNRQFPGINRHWPARLVSAGVLSIPYTSLQAAGTYPLAKGRSRPEEYSYGVISSSLSNFNRFASRDTGRNPLGGRGRRSALLTRLA